MLEFLPVILVLLAILSAGVSAVETALFSFQPGQIESLREKRAGFAGTLAALLENPRRLLSTILLADASVNAPLLIGSLAWLESQSRADLPLWAVALVLLALIVFACDLIPKLFALRAPNTVARAGTPFIRAAMPLLAPVSGILQKLADRIAEAVLPASLRTQRTLTEDELETLVELSAEQGALHETESEMISEIIKLGDKTARDCMTPRVDVLTLPDDLTNEEAAARLRTFRLRRVPVYGETPDDIEGVLDVPAFLRNPSAHYTEMLEVPSFVPETMKALALLKNFLKRPQSLAIVVDEHGGVEGIVTMADIVEEIISDAVPRSDAKLYLESPGDGSLVANGSARLDDIAEELGVTFEDADGIDTIGGLIFNQLGQLPKPGQELEAGPVHVLVRKVSRKRIEEVRITTGKKEGDE